MRIARMDTTDFAHAHKVSRDLARWSRTTPAGTRWLPVLHTERGEWRFTALFSNTAMAHQLERARDWVVMYFHTEGEAEGQRTVVTETKGQLAGRRVVRGRESECEKYYATVTSPDSQAHEVG
jgi:hypothetical protein